MLWWADCWDCLAFVLVFDASGEYVVFPHLTHSPCSIWNDGSWKYWKRHGGAWRACISVQSTRYIRVRGESDCTGERERELPLEPAACWTLPRIWCNTSHRQQLNRSWLTACTVLASIQKMLHRSKWLTATGKQTHGQRFYQCRKTCSGPASIWLVIRHDLARSLLAVCWLPKAPSVLSFITHVCYPCAATCRGKIPCCWKSKLNHASLICFKRNDLVKISTLLNCS